MQTGLQGAQRGKTPLWRAPRLRARAGVGLVEREYLLAATGGGNGRWDGCELEVTQDAREDRLLSDGGNDAQCATAAERTGRHLQSKDAAQQPGPVPIRGSRLLFLAVYTLLARGGNNRVAQLAMRCQAAGIAHEVDTW